MDKTEAERARLITKLDAELKLYQADLKLFQARKEAVVKSRSKRRQAARIAGKSKRRR